MVYGKRWENVRSIQGYIDTLTNGQYPIEAQHTIEPMERAFEALMLMLRTVDSLDLADYQEAYDIDLLEQFPSQIEVLLQRGLAKIDNGRFYLTPEGMDVQNPILCDFLACWPEDAQ